MKCFLSLTRPRQWLKNLFVLVGVFFSGQYADPGLLVQALILVLSFTLAAGAVYVFNDFVDAESDRAHPEKKTRPIASGDIDTASAVVFMAILALSSLFLAGIISIKASVIVGVYMGLNIAYSLYLKRIPVLDVFVISMGFLLRVLIGTAGIAIVPSNWLILCTLMLTLFLGYTKRFAEKQRSSGGTASRETLGHYTSDFLHTAMTITAACTIISYALYSMSPATIERHGSENLIYTVIPVTFGILRYNLLIEAQLSFEDAATSFIEDRALQVTAVLWVAMFLAIQLGLAP